MIILSFVIRKDVWFLILISPKSYMITYWISYFYTGSLRKRHGKKFDNQLVNKAVVDFLRNAKDRKGGRAARGREKRPVEEEEIQENESSNTNEEDS